MTDLTALDTLIEGYNSEQDSVLSTQFTPIHTKLWQQIENYGQSVNDYGAVVSSAQALSKLLVLANVPRRISIMPIYYMI